MKDFEKFAHPLFKYGMNEVGVKLRKGLEYKFSEVQFWMRNREFRGFYYFGFPDQDV